MNLSPNPGVHAAHGGAHHQPQMIYAQALGQEPVLSLDHVQIAVVWEFGMEAVARLARLAVADAIGGNDVILCDVQWLSRIKQLPGEFGTRELAAAASGP